MQNCMMNKMESVLWWYLMDLWEDIFSIHQNKLWQAILTCTLRAPPPTQAKYHSKKDGKTKYSKHRAEDDANWFLILSLLICRLDYHTRICKHPKCEQEHISRKSEWVSMGTIIASPYLIHTSPYTLGTCIRDQHPIILGALDSTYHMSGTGNVRCTCPSVTWAKPWQVQHHSGAKVTLAFYFPLRVGKWVTLLLNHDCQITLQA